MNGGELEQLNLLNGKLLEYAAKIVDFKPLAEMVEITYILASGFMNSCTDKAVTPHYPLEYHIISILHCTHTAGL